MFSTRAVVTLMVFGMATCGLKMSGNSTEQMAVTLSVRKVVKRAVRKRSSLSEEAIVC